MSIDTADRTLVTGGPGEADVRSDAPDLPDVPASVLRPAALTAAREQERLRLAAGKTGMAALAARLGPAIRHLGSAEAAAGGLRYRPVAWTVIAVVAVAFYLPGRADRAPSTQPAASPSPVVTAVTPTTQPPGEELAAPALPSGPTPTFAPAPSAPSFTPPPATSFTPPATTPTTIGGPAPITPLTIRGSGWATRVPPGAFPADAVPEATLPVANRLGQVDRVSFIRLAGTAGSLTLVEDEEGARDALGGGQIAICPILVSDWAEDEAQSFSDAPAWATDSCVGSVESGGRWVFDLASFPFRTGPAGFALVPSGDAPPDFQVTFRIS